MKGDSAKFMADLTHVALSYSLEPKMHAPPSTPHEDDRSRERKPLGDSDRSGGAALPGAGVSPRGLALPQVCEEATWKTGGPPQITERETSRAMGARFHLHIDNRWSFGQT